MPTDAQYELAQTHCRLLRELCRRSPENGEEWEKATLMVVTKMMRVLPGMRTSDGGSEAKTEAYMEALDDVPSWAVAEAMRGWYRGTHSGEHNFNWAPAPAALRKLSLAEAWRFEARAREIEKVLAIQPFDPTSAEHCADMRKRLKTAFPWLTVGEAP